MNYVHHSTKETGYILLFSIVLTSIMLSIMIGIANTTFRQRIFTQQVKQSTIAFYSADTALDCLTALDNRGDFGTDPADTSPPMPLSVSSDCSGDTSNVNVSSQKIGSLPNGFVYQYDSPANITDAGLISTGNLNQFCARAKVTKFEAVGTGSIGTLYRTTIDVWGYNVSCDNLNLHYTQIKNNQPSSIANYLVERQLTYTYEIDQ